MADSITTGFVSLSQAEAYKLTMPPRYKWNPKEDITAYELALSMPLFAYTSSIAQLPAGWMSEQITGLPDAARRHWDLME